MRKILHRDKTGKVFFCLVLPLIAILAAWEYGYRSLNQISGEGTNYAISLFLFLCLGLVFCVFLWNAQKITVPLKFAITAVILGTVMMFTLSPLSAPDEEYHYLCSFRLSQTLLFHTGSSLTVNQSWYDFTDFIGHQNVVSGWLRVSRELFGAMQVGEQVGLRDSSPAYCIAYLPQAIGLAIGNILGRNMVSSYMLGRFTNLLFFAFCLYGSVKLVPQHGTVMGMCGLVGMALHQVASFSYDSFVIGVSFITTSLVLRTAHKPEPISAKELLPVCLCCVLLPPLKPLYLSIPFFFLVIPKDRFHSSWKKTLCFILLFAVCVLAVVLVQRGAIDKTMTDDTLNWEGEHNYTLSFVVQHPKRTAKMFLNTLKLYGKYWYLQAFGCHYSGLNLPVPQVLPVVSSIAILLAAFNSGTETVFLSERLLLIAVCALTVFSSMIGMMITWTSDTRDSIQGIQGRYFTPILPSLYLALRSCRLKLPSATQNYPLFLLLMTDCASILCILRSTLLK